MKRTYGILAFAALVATLAFAQPASAHCILAPENDCWETRAPATQSTLPAIPGGFFPSVSGFPSDPIPAGRVVKLIGNPLPQATVSSLCPPNIHVEITYPGCHIPNLDPVTCHSVAQRTTFVDPVDTVVRRTQTLDVGTVGVNPTSQVQVIAISLKNPPTDPLVVTYNSGAISRNWDVSLVHDAAQTQTLGNSTWTPTAVTATTASGTVRVNTLPVKYKVTFTNGADTREVSNQLLTFNNTDGTFFVPSIPTGVPALSTWGLILLVALLLVSSVMLLRRYRRTPETAA